MNTKRQTPEAIVRAAFRLQRGLDLLSNPAYKFVQWTVKTDAFFVHNKSREDCCHIVHVDHWTCTCEDFQKHDGEGCKHLYACDELLNQQAQIAAYDANTVDADVCASDAADHFCGAL
jgi:hypothetical protein